MLNLRRLPQLGWVSVATAALWETGNLNIIPAHSQLRDALK